MIMDDVAYLKNHLNKPVVFIGLMGVGKTLMGEKLAGTLNFPFFDSDHQIVEQAGLSISEIFAQKGEDYFRTLERHTIATLLDNKNMILSIGGGAIMTPETAKIIWRDSISIFLNADINILYQRTKKDDKRPLLAGKDRHSILKQLQEERQATYMNANLTVNAAQNKDDVLQTIIASLTHYLKEQNSNT